MAEAIPGATVHEMADGHVACMKAAFAPPLVAACQDVACPRGRPRRLTSCSAWRAMAGIRAARCRLWSRERGEGWVRGPCLDPRAVVVGGRMLYELSVLERLMVV